MDNQPAKKSGPSKCAHTAAGCTDRAVKIVGDCRYCEKKYCSKHRLPEAHQCENIISCRQESASKLSAKLLGEKTIGSKV
ncbi:hypothetical protein HDV06_004496 [Boothiomyces sp. JEL0866]|nr:hypothetical protein HDV06_004496 [Boothiomyces sp. JEL0866]